MKVTNILIFFASSIAFAIFLQWFLTFVKKKIFIHRHNTKKTRFITELINKSMDQRCRFRLEVTAGELKGSNSEGVCVVAKNGQLCIELTETFAAQQWKDSPCLIFFQINKSSKISYFHFAGKCLDARRKGDITNLYFAIPEQLEPGQKRKSLRCIPPKGSITGFGLWPLRPDKPLPVHKTDIGKPLVIYRPNQSNSIAISDISAGGMCMVMRPHSEGSGLSSLKAGTRILGLVMLKGLNTNKKPVALWLSCRIISVTHLEKKNIWRICIRFDTWASMNEENSEILWFPNDESGCVPTLGNLILHWNMQIHKKSKT